jgi:GNAT superfamily N-acetyltransferase
MEKNIRIIPLNECPEFYPILAHWSFCQWYTERDIPFSTLLAAYNKRVFEKSMPYTFTAVCGTLPVGMASLKENDLWSRKDINPWLASVYVIPQFRRSGIGSMLIGKVLEKAESENFKRIHLFLGSSDNALLEKYYTKRGWKFLESAVDNDGKGTKIFFIEK